MKDTEKNRLLEHCRQLIDTKVDSLRDVLQKLSEARANETKSSAGDKFETGRAMLQIEEEKAGRQLLNAIDQQSQLDQFARIMTGDIVAPGSLVKTAKKRSYYFGVGLGKVVLEGSTYFCISVDAPIGQVMAGKSVGDSFTFNEKTDKILELF